MGLRDECFFLLLNEHCHHTKYDCDVLTNEYLFFTPDVNKVTHLLHQQDIMFSNNTVSVKNEILRFKDVQF
jgi:hypothetical protein